jgi:hypothetical protein
MTPKLQPQSLTMGHFAGNSVQEGGAPSPIPLANAVEELRQTVITDELKLKDHFSSSWALPPWTTQLLVSNS